MSGDAGMAEIDLVRHRLVIYGEHGEMLDELNFSGFNRNDMFLQQARHILECITTRKVPKVDLHAGIQSLRLALAAKESLANGIEISLSESF